MRPRCFAVSIAIFAALAGCQRLRREVEPTPPERTDIRKITRQIPPHEAIPGTSARTALLFTTTIPDLRATVEVREYYVSDGNELEMNLPSCRQAKFCSRFAVEPSMSTRAI